MREKGFTLIELLTVIAIIIILSVVGFTTFNSSLRKGRDAQRKNDLSQLAIALEAYYSDSGDYPEHNMAGKVLGCGDEGVDACVWQRDYSFSAVLRGSTVVYLKSMPEEPITDKNYFYEKTENGYSLYASLENWEDKDVKINDDGEKDLGGWTDCGQLGGGDVYCFCGGDRSKCNYKLTESGVVTR